MREGIMISFTSFLVVFLMLVILYLVVYLLKYLNLNNAKSQKTVNLNNSNTDLKEQEDIVIISAAIASLLNYENSFDNNYQINKIYLTTDKTMTWSKQHWKNVNYGRGKE